MFGALLLSSRLQDKFATATSGLSSAGNSFLAQLTLDGLIGQFVLGLLLGIVWSPCVGPTLGAAVTLASQGQSLVQVSILMALFGIGAGLPLVAFGLLSRQAMLRFRGKLLIAGSIGKQAFGGILIFLGITILFGADKILESWIVKIEPAWLISLTTSI